MGHFDWVQSGSLGARFQALLLLHHLVAWQSASRACKLAGSKKVV
jgi:hypothetical protein